MKGAGEALGEAKETSNRRQLGRSIPRVEPFKKQRRASRRTTVPLEYFRVWKNTQEGDERKNIVENEGEEGRRRRRQLGEGGEKEGGGRREGRRAWACRASPLPPKTRNDLY